MIELGDPHKKGLFTVEEDDNEEVKVDNNYT
jgi:hypothetical protein